MFSFRNQQSPAALPALQALFETRFEISELAGLLLDGNGSMISTEGESVPIHLRARIAERDVQNRPLRATGFLQELEETSALSTSTPHSAS